MRTSILTAVLTLVLTSVLNATTAPPSTGGKVNVNTATEAQLQLLPGVGPKLANEIYTYAEAGPKLYDPSAPVNSECDHKCHIPDLRALDNVRGIGPNKLQSLAPYVTFTGPTTLTAKVRKVKPNGIVFKAPPASTAPDSGPKPRCAPGTRCAG